MTARLPLRIKTLQQLFLESRGGPVEVAGKQVIQMDRLPVKRGKLTVRAAQADAEQGVALETPRGEILLSDGGKMKLLHTWFSPQLPLTVEHEFDCGDGELRCWNVYRVRHRTGEVTIDKWTGNAGMVVESATDNCRRYSVSDGLGDFDPSFKFEIKWA